MEEEIEKFEPEKSKNDVERIEELTEVFLQDLVDNPKYQSFFSPYNKSSVDLFKRIWANRKAILTVYPELYKNLALKNETGYRETAKEKLWEIQQRKLFDMQCLWRANQLKIPGINTTYDFDYWSDIIEECPFLSPISLEEYERYYNFISVSSWSDIFEEEIDIIDWQDYTAYKSCYLDEKNFDKDPPAWYDYYDAVTGKSYLYLLPDLKWDKELDYYRKGMKFLNGKREEKKEELPPVLHPNLPGISWFDDELREEFIRDFEDGKTYFLYKCEQRFSGALVDDDLEEAVRILKTAGEPVYLSSSKNWYENIIDTANNFTRKKLIDELPGAYQNYLFRINNNLPFETKHSERKEDSIELKKEYEENILLGRELSGEPRDFNF